MDRAAYLALKQEHPNEVLLVRVGDFYEAYDEDARRMAAVLNITLTSTTIDGERVPLAACRYDKLAETLRLLVRDGLRVAVRNQVGRHTLIQVVTKDTLPACCLDETVRHNLTEARKLGPGTRIMLDGETHRVDRVRDTEYVLSGSYNSAIESRRVTINPCGSLSLWIDRYRPVPGGTLWTVTNWAIVHELETVRMATLWDGVIDTFKTESELNGWKPTQGVLL